jgi:signal peptide peptidase SppA
VAADASVKAIVLLVDSPGGYTGMVPETAALLRQIRAQKPIVAAVTGMNASAAYWVTSNATAIDATTSALVGSIGVYAIRPSIARQLQADGVDVEVISAGRYKAEGNIALPMTDAERQATQARVDEAYDGFVGDVAAGRGVSASVVRTGFGEGRIVSATRAVQLGMIDRVALVETTIERTLTTTGTRAWLSDEADADDRRRRRLLDLPARGRTAGDGADEIRRRRLRLA